MIVLQLWGLINDNYLEVFVNAINRPLFGQLKHDDSLIYGTSQFRLLSVGGGMALNTVRIISSFPFKAVGGHEQQSGHLDNCDKYQDETIFHSNKLDCGQFCHQSISQPKCIDVKVPFEFFF